jgi:F-type H+-transporting ATPase subunit b
MRRDLSRVSRWLALGLTMAGSAVLTSAPALAAEEGKAGLPQLDPAGFMPQLIWLAISFVVLYLILSRVALPRIASVLDERERQMQSDIERAEKLKAEAEEALAAYERTMAEARAAAQGELRQAAQAVAADAAARESTLGAKLAQQSEAAERAIVAAKQAAVADLRKMAGEIAGAVAGKLAGVQIAGADLAAAVDQVVRERR